MLSNTWDDGALDNTGKSMVSDVLVGKNNNNGPGRQIPMTNCVFMAAAQTPWWTTQPRRHKDLESHRKRNFERLLKTADLFLTQSKLCQVSDWVTLIGIYDCKLHKLHFLRVELDSLHKFRRNVWFWDNGQWRYLMELLFCELLPFICRREKQKWERVSSQQSSTELALILFYASVGKEFKGPACRG